MTNKLNKKTVIAIGVLIAALMAGIYFVVTSSLFQSGSKKISIQVTGKNQSTVEYSLKTDAMVLEDAMKEADGLTYEAEGGFLNTINGETADWNVDQSYWAIYVNGEYGMYGIAQQPVADGDIFLFQYTTE